MTIKGRQQRRSSCLISEGCNEDHQRFWKFKSWICSSWPGRPSLIEYHPTPFKTRSYQIGSWDSLESWPDMWFMIFLSFHCILHQFVGCIFLVQMTIHNVTSWCLSNGPWNKIVMSFESTTCATGTSGSASTSGTFKLLNPLNLRKLTSLVRFKLIGKWVST